MILSRDNSIHSSHFHSEKRSQCQPLTMHRLFIAFFSRRVASAQTVGVTPHQQYSPSIGVPGCPIDTNRAAYFPAQPSCTKFGRVTATSQDDRTLLARPGCWPSRSASPGTPTGCLAGRRGPVVRQMDTERHDIFICSWHSSHRGGRPITR